MFSRAKSSVSSAASAVWNSRRDPSSSARPRPQIPSSGKTVAFFYITAAGTVNVRKSADYVPRMIEMAGGSYVFPDLDSGSALSTVNMTMEAFYDGAKNADLLIYNSTIDGSVETIDDLLQKNDALRDFRAGREETVDELMDTLQKLMK